MLNELHFIAVKDSALRHIFIRAKERDNKFWIIWECFESNLISLALCISFLFQDPHPCFISDTLPFSYSIQAFIHTYSGRVLSSTLSRVVNTWTTMKAEENRVKKKGIPMLIAIALDAAEHNRLVASIPTYLTHCCWACLVLQGKHIHHHVGNDIDWFSCSWILLHRTLQDSSFQTHMLLGQTDPVYLEVSEPQFYKNHNNIKQPPGLNRVVEDMWRTL